MALDAFTPDFPTPAAPRTFDAGRMRKLQYRLGKKRDEAQQKEGLRSNRPYSRSPRSILGYISIQLYYT